MAAKLPLFGEYKNFPLDPSAVPKHAIGYAVASNVALGVDMSSGVGPVYSRLIDFNMDYFQGIRKELPLAPKKYTIELSSCVNDDMLLSSMGIGKKNQVRLRLLAVKDPHKVKLFFDKVFDHKRPGTRLTYKQFALSRTMARSRLEDMFPIYYQNYAQKIRAYSYDRDVYIPMTSTDEVHYYVQAYESNMRNVECVYLAAREKSWEEVRQLSAYAEILRVHVIEGSLSLDMMLEDDRDYEPTRRPQPTEQSARDYETYDATRRVPYLGGTYNFDYGNILLRANITNKRISHKYYKKSSFEVSTVLADVISTVSKKGVMIGQRFNAVNKHIVPKHILNAQHRGLFVAPAKQRGLATAVPVEDLELLVHFIYKGALRTQSVKVVHVCDDTFSFICDKQLTPGTSGALITDLNLVAYGSLERAIDVSMRLYEAHILPVDTVDEVVDLSVNVKNGELEVYTADNQCDLLPITGIVRVEMAPLFTIDVVKNALAVKHAGYAKNGVIWLVDNDRRNIYFTVHDNKLAQVRTDRYTKSLILNIDNPWERLEHRRHRYMSRHLRTNRPKRASENVTCRIRSHPI